MARQHITVVNLLLLATVGLAFAAAAPSPSSAVATKHGLPTFSGVPEAGPVGPAADNNEVGTVGGADSTVAPSPGGGATDSVSAGAVGGPVSDSIFGSIGTGTAEGPKPSAAIVGQLSAGTAVAAAVASSLFF